MSLNETSVIPFPKEEIKESVWKAHGFVSAKLQQPFRSVEVEMVSQAALAENLRKMIREVKEISSVGEKTPAFLKKPLTVGEDFVTDAFLNLISRRILGLYTQSYLEDTPGKLLLVGENIETVARTLDLPLREFFLWVLVHETMHIAQFNSDQSYLRDYIKERVLEITGQEKSSKESLQKATTAMTWIEGSADAMMDESGLIEKGLIEKMRQKTEERRDKISWSSIVLQILTRKKTQYRQGRRFTEVVSEKYDISLMSLIINDPDWLPSPEEIKAPSLWIQRFEKSISQKGKS